MFANLLTYVLLTMYTIMSACPTGNIVKYIADPIKQYQHRTSVLAESYLQAKSHIIKLLLLAKGEAVTLILPMHPSLTPSLSL